MIEKHDLIKEILKKRIKKQEEEQEEKIVTGILISVVSKLSDCNQRLKNKKKK